MLCVCVRECMCVCVCQLYSIAKWLEHQPANLKAVGSMPGDTALVLLLFPLLILIQSSWWLEFDWGHSPPSCNINGYLL